jgi:hypothetical protein
MNTEAEINSGEIVRFVRIFSGDRLGHLEQLLLLTL